MANLIGTRIEWGRLITDPEAPGFWSQKVAGPTEECPEGSLVGDTRWYFPPQLAGGPAGHFRHIDWSVGLADGVLTDPGYRQLLTMCVNVAVCLLQGCNRSRHLSLSSVKARTVTAIDLAIFIAQGPWKHGRRSLPELTPQDGEAFIEWKAKGWRTGTATFERFEVELQQLQGLHLAGHLRDGFRPETLDAMQSALRRLASADGAIEPSRPGMSETEFSAAPYSVAFCLSVLDISDFYIDNLADDIVTHVEHLTRFVRDEQKLLDQGVKLSSNNTRRSCKRYRAFARAYEWRISTLPFVHDYAFPPRSVSELVTVVQMLQTGNIQKVAMATAAREGELLWMEPGCLSKFLADDTIVDLISSRRYKNERSLGGASIGWPVPSAAAQAVLCQEQLAAAAGSQGLWLQLAHFRIGGRMTTGTFLHLQRFAKLHRLDVGPEATAYVQRYRPNMALLLMTGQGGSPYLIQGALGHESVETTEKYLRMNRHLQSDLAAHLRRGRAHVPQSDESPVLIPETGVEPEELEQILKSRTAGGMHAYLVGPGVLVFAEDEGAMTTWRSTEGDLAALRFALETITARASRKAQHLLSWLRAETLRIAQAHPDCGNALSPRLTGYLRLLTDEAAGAVNATSH